MTATIKYRDLVVSGQVTKGSPLTNLEIDTNFKNLSDEVDLKVSASDYEDLDVLNKIKNVDGSGSGLDADLLDGKTTASTNTVNTVVVRDGTGSFAAGAVTFSSINSGSVVLTAGSNIVFEGTTDNDFETTLTAGDPTADRILALPNVSGTLVSTGDTGTVTNAMLAGSITNDKLVNNSITIDGNAVALGGSVSLATAAISWTGVQTFFDDKLQIKDNVDNTKTLTLQISNISPNTTRTLTAPDTNGVIATREYVQTSGYNSQGTKTVSTSAPTTTVGYNDGDIWYQY